MHIDELWVAFAVKKRYRYITIHMIANKFGREPQTEAALKEHIKRAVYQAGYCWGQTLIANQMLLKNGAGRKAQTITGLLSGRHFQKQPKCDKSWSKLLQKSDHANACLFHFHAQRSATAREPVINNNVLDTFHLPYIYIHVLELFNVK